ncbi:MAG: alpha/beta hydrolase, partial [Thermogutta sp.]|nr:alpha/beta hydrolase [Thermogutta sp.]
MRCHGLTLRSRWWSFVVPILLTAVAVFAAANRGALAASGGGKACDCPASGDAGTAGIFWVVSSRGVGDPESNPADAVNRLRFYEAHAAGSWSPISGDDLLQAIAGEKPVVVWIHGNRMELRDAVRSAAALKRVLDRLVPDRRYVLVGWSWPADRMVRGVRQDSRLKSCRSLQEAALLAHWIDQTLRNRTVVLVGYSFGAQTALKTAALLGGAHGPEGISDAA